MDLTGICGAFKADGDKLEGESCEGSGDFASMIDLSKINTLCEVARGAISVESTRIQDECKASEQRRLESVEMLRARHRQHIAEFVKRIDTEYEDGMDRLRSAYETEVQTMCCHRRPAHAK
jgi:hypothetical protein